MNIHRIVFPEDDSAHWFESLERFISETKPEWLSGLKGVSSWKIRKLKKYYDLNRNGGKTLPIDYETFLRHWGGSPDIYFPYKPLAISYFSVDDLLRFSKVSDQSSDSFYLMIGTQDIDNATHLSFLFPPSPEAEAWRKENSFNSELSDQELEDIGFNLQVEKLQTILTRHGYQQVWFSTPLDQVWLRSDSFCSISREFDPNDMFDTVMGQICTYDLAEIQNVIKDFAQIGYQCVDDKKFRDY